MQIFVKDTRTDKMHTIDIDDFETSTILSIKNIIKSKIGYKVEEMELIYGGLKLQNGNGLNDYNITKEVTIHLKLKGIRGNKMLCCRII